MAAVYGSFGSTGRLFFVNFIGVAIDRSHAAGRSETHGKKRYVGGIALRLLLVVTVRHRLQSGTAQILLLAFRCLLGADGAHAADYADDQHKEHRHQHQHNAPTEFIQHHSFSSNR